MVSTEEQLTAALFDGYRRTGKEVGYWAARFRESLKLNGGLKTAKRMLKPRTAEQRKGLDVLLEANRPDLSLEAIILDPKFSGLFTASELQTAQERLGDFAKKAADHLANRENLYPDELEPGKTYAEGAKKQIRVNAYERSPQARKACLAHYGHTCRVCGLDFKSRYGSIGEGFIHVHHVNPIALSDGSYKVDPVNDLRPVCPNCHAMLHRTSNNVLSIDQLKSLMREQVTQKQSVA